MPIDRLHSLPGRVLRWWRLFAGYRPALAGAVVIGMFVLMAVAHPLLLETVWPERVYHPEVGHDRSLIHPTPPSLSHPLGTDVLGRDVLSMVMAAARPTLVLGAAAALVTAVVGTVIAAVSAYRRGLVDGFFSRLADALLLLPAPILMIILGSRFNRVIGPFEFGVIYGLLTGAGGAAIVLRSHALSVMGRPFVEASRVAGAGGRRIVFGHLVPHVVPLAAAYMLLAVTGAVVADGFLAFLGTHDVRMNWGTIMYWSLAFEGSLAPSVAWHVFLPAAVAITLFCASFYLVGLGLQRLVEPGGAEASRYNRP